MKQISLNGAWKLSGCPEGHPEKMLKLSGEVPGCAQLDLSRAGILPADLFMGMNVKETEKYEDYEWWYSRTFTAPTARERVFLVFRAVDCLAEYFLNGERIGSSNNMFIPVEFEIGSLLRDGENELTVHLSSPVVAAHGEDYDLFAMDITWRETPVNTAIRRAPHTYGWDIFPRAVTAGIWRDVYLEMRDEICFTQAFFDMSQPTGPRFCFDTASRWEDFHDVEIEIEGACGDSRFYHRTPFRYKSGRIYFTLDNPKLWWPYGYGEPNVYDAEARIYRAGELIHTTKTSFGVRSVELDRTDSTDGKNGRFRFLVNGVEIMCKGSNWVPLDAFHCRDASRYGRALELVRDIGCNILRCWGGGVYEDHPFFDFCDRNGIMVWQDFSMACNNYPQRESFFESIRKEATAVVREYRHHASIVLWSGDNEVDQMMAKNGARPSQNRISREILPEVVLKNDVARPYLASSPYISDASFDRNGRSAQGSPEDHLWGPRDFYKADFYKQSAAHFVSETGYHGCPSLESIKKFITPENVWPYYNEEWTLHSSDQKNNPHRVELMEKQVRQLFGTVPTDPETYILASQLSQAEAKKYFIERIRIGRPLKTGVIWWNLLDGWPQMSDAVVDYFFTKKIAYRYIKRSQAPFSIAADEISGWHTRFYALNDTQVEKAGHLTVLDAETDAILREIDFTAAKNTATEIGELPVFYSEQKMLIFKWTLSDGSTGFNHYLCGYPAFSLDSYKEWMEKYSL